MKPLSYTQKRYLSSVEKNPGISRAELCKLLYVEMPYYYSSKKIRKIHKTLESRGLVELGVIREGGRYGVPGVYLVGQKRESRPGYLGVFGWVNEEKHG